MVLVTTETISGRELETLKMVHGSTVQSVHAGKDFMAGFKTLVGGELTSYTEMMDNARKIATKRMMDEAMSIGADAIVAIKYTSSAITQGASEVMVSGTAVKFKN